MEKINFKKHQYTIAVCVLFALIYILPLLILDTFYSDDLWKYLSGSGWPVDGRPLATGMSQFFSGSEKIKDLSPYTTIATVIITALAGYCITLIAGIEQSKRIKFSALVLLTSPFLIENLCYKYDSITFAFSFLAVVLPFFFVNSTKKFILFSAIGIFLTFITYQASLTLYMLMTILVAITYTFKKPIAETLKFIGIAALSFVVGFLLVKVYNLIFPMEISGRDVTIFQDANVMESFSKNCVAAYDIIYSTLNIHYIIFFTVLSVALLASLVMLFMDKGIKTISKVLALPLIAIAPFFIVFIILFFPKAYDTPRVFVGFSIFIYILLIVIDRYLPKITSYLAIFYVLIALPEMVSVTKYIKVQNDFQTYVVNDIVQHVNVDNKKIVFDGELPVSENAAIARYGYPMFNYFYINYLGNENYLFNEYFKYKTHNLYAVSFPVGDKRLKMIRQKENYPIVHKTNFYYIRANENGVIIDFNRQGIQSATIESIGTLDNALKQNIDAFEQSGNQLNIRGWTYFEKEDSNNTKIRLALINTTTNAVFSTQVTPEKRPDVSNANGGSYDNCGFSTTINLKEVANGSYKVTLVLENSKSRAYIITSKAVEVNNVQLP